MIIVRLSGGMGNQMFQYALGRTLSLANGVPLGLDLSFLLDRTPHPSWQHFTFREYDLSIFNIEAEVIPRKRIPFLYRWHFSGRIMLYVDALRRRFFKTPGNEKSFRFDPCVLSLGPNAYLEGSWQSPKYFADIDDVLRRDFTMKDALPESTEALLSQIKNSNSVCIHVRRGDFVGNSFHGVASLAYYRESLARLRELVQIDTLYVFSDDIAWCEKNLSLPLPTVFVSDEYRGEKARGHFALMVGCRHFIIANSSFSWWAAWLGSAQDKVVIAPKQWFGDPSIHTEDLIPEQWIRI